jgi:DUF4097 and DUF4098 domain-containing protein YvlB
MKTFNLTLAVCILCTSASMSQDFEYSFKEDYKVSIPARLALSSFDGNIEIIPSDGNVIQVYYIVKKDIRLMRIGRAELEKELIVEVDHDNDRLEISVKPKDNWTFNWRDRMNVHFKVYVPTQTSCDLNTSDGNVALSGLSGPQQFRTSDGNIRVSEIGGDIRGSTSDGNILAERIKGSAELKTSDGDLILENIAGNVRSSTSDGNIRIMKVNGDISLRTSDGDISFETISGSLEAVTSDGNVKGNMADLRNQLTVRTSDGNIDLIIPEGLGLNLNIKGESLQVPLTNFTGHSDDERIEGQLNGGGVAVNLVTSDGRVKLSHQ